MEKLIAYVGLFKFPYGEAASKRVLENAKLFNSLGYKVIIGHGGNLDYTQEYLLNDEFNISYCGLNESFSNFNKIKKLFMHFFNGGKETVKWLESLDQKPEYVIVYGGFYTYASKILSYCKRKNIKIIFDVVEWYEPSQMLGGRYGFFYNSFSLAFKYIYPKADGIICISKNLKKVFKNNITVVIPPLAHFVNPIQKIKTLDTDQLKLVYAGNIGNKDYLSEIIKVVNKLSGRFNIAFDIYGPSIAEIKEKCGILDFSDSVHICGRVQQSQINLILAQYDFLIFVRPDSHCNKYGFPSKFSESLGIGLPVATNLTSDLSEYLIDGYNGYIISNIDFVSIENTILKMLLLKSKEKEIFKINSINTVKEKLSYKSSVIQSNISDFFLRLEDSYENS